MEYNKKFIILGNNNAITYKEFFPLLKENKIWTGYKSNKTMIFRVGEGYKYDEKITKEIGDGHHYGKVPSITWFTNLDIPKRHIELIPTLKYEFANHPELYQKYDNYDAINIDKVKDIPYDYYEPIGVPITFMDKYNPDEFEILGMSSSAGYDKNIVGIKLLKEGDARPLVNNKNTYARIFIKRRTK